MFSLILCCHELKPMTQTTYCWRRITNPSSLLILGLLGRKRWLRWWPLRLGHTVGWLLRFGLSVCVVVHDHIFRYYINIIYKTMHVFMSSIALQYSDASSRREEALQQQSRCLQLWNCVMGASNKSDAIRGDVQPASCLRSSIQGLIFFFPSLPSDHWVSGNQPLLLLLKTLQQERPGMPEGISPSLAFIVQSCWVEDPNMRPSFSQIIRLLNEFLLTLTPPPPPPQPLPETDTNRTNGGAITEFSSRAKGKFAFIRQLFAAKRNRNS